MKKIKIVIVDDHQLFREGLKSLLLNAPDLDIVKEVSTEHEISDTFKNNKVDVVLINIDMPMQKGIEAVKSLIKNLPNVNVLALSIHNQKSFIENIIAVGVKGYLLKNTDAETLLLAVKKVAKGEFFFDSNVTLTVLGNRTTSASHHLSEKEVTILKYIEEGFPNKQIADKLRLSTRTVDTYRATIMKKLNVRNVAELISYTIRNGII